MNKKFRIRAKTLELAIRRARVQFGNDSMIEDTRHLKVKDPQGLGIEPLVEITIVPGKARGPVSLDPELEAASRVFPYVESHGEYLEKLQEDVKRIESLIKSVAWTEAKLQSVGQNFPLGDTLLASGAAPGSVRVLQSSFEEKIPASQWHSIEEARRHLSRYLECSHAGSFAEIAGPHVFLGSAGCGKTSLVINLATALGQLRKEIAILVVTPYHSGEVKRIETAAAAILCDAAVIRDVAEFDEAMAMYSGKDVILIDTPCWLSHRQPETQAVFDRLKQKADVYRHFVCNLTSDFDFIQAELELYRQYRCDFLAVSRLDLARRTGKIVDLVLNCPVTFSFLSYESPRKSGRPGVSIASADSILGYISPRLKPSGPGKAEEKGASR
jgi:hypothetical protein